MSSQRRWCFYEVSSKKSLGVNGVVSSSSIVSSFSTKKFFFVFGLLCTVRIWTLLDSCIVKWRSPWDFSSDIICGFRFETVVSRVSSVPKLLFRRVDSFFNGTSALTWLSASPCLLFSITGDYWCFCPFLLKRDCFGVSGLRYRVRRLEKEGLPRTDLLSERGFSGCISVQFCSFD